MRWGDSAHILWLIGVKARHTVNRREFPFWLLAIALLGVLIAWAILANHNYALIWIQVSKGIGTTLWVTVVSFVLSCALALPIVMARTSRHRILREISTFYVEIMRGIPMLVLLFYMAFVGAPWLVSGYQAVFGIFIDAGLMPDITVRNFDLTWRAILALTLGYSAFISEVFRAGIQAVDRGQAEAARALGFSRLQTFRLIIWPQALKLIVPPLGNDLISMIKDSALVAALGVQDVTLMGKVTSASNFQFFETYNVVACIYLVMTISLSILVKLFEYFMAKNDRVMKKD